MFIRRLWIYAINLSENRTNSSTSSLLLEYISSLNWSKLESSDIYFCCQRWHVLITINQKNRGLLLEINRWGSCISNLLFYFQSPWFYLTAPPNIIGNQGVPENISVVEKSSVSLTCEASGIPLPSITWLKDGWPVSLGSSVKILSGIHNSDTLIIWLPSCERCFSSFFFFIFSIYVASFFFLI